ncbi:MAG: hypothetical protein SFY80_16735 [Verrucomicrobiota bacterium]|nr:hypothetical protein [Verrucomicrobiota bacterium]
MSEVRRRDKTPDEPFSPLMFIVIILGTLAVVFGGIWLVAPAFWAGQVGASWLALLGVFLAGHMTAGFVEFVFHRYVLHSYPIPFLKHFYEQHTLHHGLTNVKLITKDNGRRVFNRYPIVAEKQHEASYFPWYSLIIFILIGAPFMAVLQWLFPSLPIVLGSVLAVTWSVVLYELLHAVEHLSYEEFWQKKIDHPRWGKLWSAIYCFHLRHHANIQCNEAISGFFGIPVPDFVFRTYMPSRIVLVDGVPAIEQDFAPPKPIGIIAFIDRLAEKSTKKSMAH